MKILHLSAANISTGAGIACVRLHEQLLKNGIDSKILFLDEKSIVNKTYLSKTNGFYTKTIRKLYTLLDNLLKYFYQYDKNKYFSAGYFGFNLNQLIKNRDFDIIHLHWINHGFVKISSLIKTNIPIIWTMHDCWPFTGGCHHFYNCNNYLHNCGNCIILSSNKKYDLSYIMHNQKNKYDNKIKFVAISDWMFKTAKNSSLLQNRDVVKIVSGINTDIFKFITKSDVEHFELFNNSNKIVLIGAQSLNSHSKGIDFAVKALNEYSKQPLNVVTFGNGFLELSNPLHNVINLGFIKNPKKIANLFAISDLFISTPLVESFGMAIAEAQCCGLPVIIFNNTGPEEIVKHLNSGYIAEHSSTDDIINGINYCLTNDFNRRQISENAINDFSIINSTKKYITEYNNLLIN